MKTYLKLIAIAAAFGLAPVVALAATPHPSAPAPATTAAAPAAPVAAAPAPATGAAAPATASTPAPAATGSAAAPAAHRPTFQHAEPDPTIGQPQDVIGLQQQVNPIGEEAVWFHNMILVPLITVISLFVLGLLLYVVARYRRGAHPTPSRNSHNTFLEVAWTLVPVLILVMVAVPSIRLLAHQYDPPRADVTVKVTGNQWYWEYEYPDLGIHLVSNMLPDDQADATHQPRQLAVDERLVVPVGANVKVITTSNDVIHSWGVPAFWVKMDAVPGRLNETWFRAERPGVYYGVCYELCGARHGYMPIAVEVVTPERFAQWVASEGGHMAGAPAAAAPATPTNTVSATQGTASTPAPTNVAAARETPPTTNQGATR